VNAAYSRKPSATNQSSLKPSSSPQDDNPINKTKKGISLLHNIEENSQWRSLQFIALKTQNVSVLQFVI
jgi:hypothetical protein